MPHGQDARPAVIATWAGQAVVLRRTAHCLAALLSPLFRPRRSLSACLRPPCYTENNNKIYKCVLEDLGKRRLPTDGMPGVGWGPLHALPARRRSP